MWPFKRKSLDISTLPPIASGGRGEDNWTLSMLDDEDGPLVIRLNQSAIQWAGHKDLPVKIGFAFPLAVPVPGGLPNPEENRALNEVEDIVLDHVGRMTIGNHVCTNTNGIMKEFVLYIPEKVDIKTLHEQLIAAVPKYDVQCIAEREPKWQTYRNLMQLAASGQQISS